MKNHLNRQFIALIICILMVPVLFGVSFSYYLDNLMNESGSGIKIMFSLLGRAGIERVDDEWVLDSRFQSILDESSAALQILNEQGEAELVYAPEGKESFDKENFSGMEYNVFKLSFHDDGNDYSLQIVIPQSVVSAGTGRHVLFPLLFMLPFIITILVVVVFSIVMLRGINRKIVGIESSMAEIASGNLDAEVSVKESGAFSTLSASLERMRLQLKEDADSQARFLMAVTHDLKTPLASIEGYIDALQDGFADDPEKQKKFLRIMKEKSSVLSERISALIDFAKLSTSDWVEKMEPVRVDRFIDDLIDEITMEAELHQFSLKVSPLPELDFSVAMDANLVHRALENIFQNAMKYSDELRALTFSVYKRFKSIDIEIGNLGRGIDKENFEKVFSPFFRESSGRNESGSGLGLSIVKSVIDAHGWNLSVESTPNEMTAFTVHIPRKLVLQ